MTAAVVDLPRRRGRPSNADLVARVARQSELLTAARMERRALVAEGLAFADDVRAAGRRIEYAIAADRPDVALHVAAHLESLADRHSRQRGGTPA